MTDLLARSYYWPKMEKDIEAYIKMCLICQYDKIERKKEAGLLQPLLVLIGPWILVSLDFISGFLEVNKLTSVLVVVDRFSKYVVFVVAPSSCPLDVAAELFYKHVEKHFGLPLDIVSDRDARFT